jgi:HK97 family phage major capsid protein
MTAGLDLEPAAGELLTAGEPPAPGTWRSALYRPDAPGAALDSQPWARSWGHFMRAVLDERDSSARQFIANVMESRPRNAGFAEQAPSEGGFLVPEYLRSQVLAYMTSAVVRPHAMVLPMGSLRLGVPYLDNPSQANGAQSLGGMTFAWAAEGAPITPSNPAFGKAALEARKAAAYLQSVPGELVDDAAGAFGDFLARVIALGYAWFEDESFISGSGTGCPQGLISAPCAVQIDRTTASAVTFLDVVAMLKALHPAAKQAGLTPGVTSTAWLLSSAAFDQVLELYYNPAGTEVVPPSGWFSLGDGDQVGPSMLGLPLRVTDHQPALGTTGDVVLADLSQYLIGDRMEMTVELSRKGGSFAEDATNFRVKSRVDGRYWIQSETTTEAGQSVSPVVVLDTHS